MPSFDHSFTRTSEPVTIWPRTRSSSRRIAARVAAQDAVAQAGGLDEPRLGLHAVAGVALGLVDRDLAQREEPADDDDGDRREAARA